MIQILNNGIYYYDDSYYFDSLNDENNVYFIADTFSIVLMLVIHIVGKYKQVKTTGENHRRKSNEKSITNW